MTGTTLVARALIRLSGEDVYKLTRAIPKSLQSALPTVEQLEAELSAPDAAKQPPKRKNTAKQTTKKKVAKTRKGT